MLTVATSYACTNSTQTSTDTFFSEGEVVPIAVASVFVWLYACAVTLTTVPASVRVFVSLATATAAQASAVAMGLRSALSDEQAASALLGVPVEAISPIEVVLAPERCGPGWGDLRSAAGGPVSSTRRGCGGPHAAGSTAGGGVLTAV